MEMCMEPLCNLQQDVKNTLANTKLNFEKCPKERLTEAYITTRLDFLEEQWKSFTDTHRTILTEIEVVDYRKSSYYIDQVYEATLEIYYDYKTMLKESLDNIVEKASTVKNNNQPSIVTTMSEVKLPKITIPIFSGDYSEWTSFRDLFMSLIHNNPNLDNVQKLHYLKAHLAGEADQLLRHVSVSDANYSEAWTLLNNRFSNRKYLSNCLLQRLISQPIIAHESSKAIKALLDTTADCLTGLKNQGVDVSSWDLIVIYLLSSKLDSETRKLWEAQINKTDDFPTTEQFKLFLEHRFRSLEFLVLKSKPVPTNIRVNVHHATTVVCQFCSESHRLFNCKSFAAESIETRREFARINSLCYNCMVPGYSAFLCRQISRCHKCNKKHHSLLHIGVGKSTDNQVKNPSVDLCSTRLTNGKVNNFAPLHSSVQDQVLLPTALINVPSPSGPPLTLRSLLDQGSQASFITESAVKSLGLQKVSNKIIVSGVGDQHDTNISKAIVNFNFQSIHDSSCSISVKAHVLNKLSPVSPPKKVKNQVYPHLSNIKLADPYYHSSNNIDLILGADIVSNILTKGLLKGPPGSPLAQSTVLGWILSG